MSPIAALTRLRLLNSERMYALDLLAPGRTVHLPLGCNMAVRWLEPDCAIGDFHKRGPWASVLRLLDHDLLVHIPNDGGGWL